ncbi:hypothetical protein PRIPAC_77334 [Pristionchus pacificus]|uniref:Abhydro_lipase domain-containing protein n=1 Tax=Pristionchus pacificus TaxID=54126 RepID=A0A2A6CJE6_PRIPA|nr:hypothetical protein PRIPAC_77334 [Pristionchus pacificus]|eukprot:PDM78236.1 hypothetical protein PRIPAC_30815 [Pristionchus pacificus]
MYLSNYLNRNITDDLFPIFEIIYSIEMLCIFLGRPPYQHHNFALEILLKSIKEAEMVAHWGYPVEEYDVITTGYILNMIRIPRARASKTDNSTCHRPPILMVHGVMVDATEYVINPSASSPGMILSDAGFDVFLLSTHNDMSI